MSSINTKPNSGIESKPFQKNTSNKNIFNFLKKKPSKILQFGFIALVLVITGLVAYSSLNEERNVAKAAGTIPGDITGVTSTTDTTGNDILSWTAPASDGGDPITDYEIRYSTDNFASVNNLLNDGVNTALTYNLSSSKELIAGTAYQFKVFAKNGNGLSATSPLSTLASYDCDVSRFNL